VDVYISYVRKKLAALDSQCVIRTVRGAGYALAFEPRRAGVPRGNLYGVSRT
jgi:DNA-binding winged helix-turn-helix (wHTH) protein